MRSFARIPGREHGGAGAMFVRQIFAVRTHRGGARTRTRDPVGVELLRASVHAGSWTSSRTVAPPKLTTLDPATRWLPELFPLPSPVSRTSVSIVFSRISHPARLIKPSPGHFAFIFFHSTFSFSRPLSLARFIPFSPFFTLASITQRVYDRCLATLRPPLTQLSRVEIQSGG